MPHSNDHHGGDIFAVARTLGVSPGTITDFSASINPLGISPLVRETVIGAIDTLVHYPDSSHRTLKQALAEHHNLAPENFAVANGSNELIYHLPALLHGRKALIISPAFSEYARALNQHGWEMEHFILPHTGNFSIDTDRLAEKLSQGFDALFLCNPGNPNGTLYPRRVVEQIYGLCVETGTFLVLDEAFMDFCEEATAKHFVVNADDAIVLRSMTKFFALPGLRLGYSISNAALAVRMNALGGPWSVNSLALAAGVAALKDIGHNRETVRFVRHEKRSLVEKLEEFPQFRVYPSAANFLLVEIKDGTSARRLKDQLLAHHRILIRNCSDFRGLSASFFRIAVRTGEENQRLIDGLGEILKK